MLWFFSSMTKLDIVDPYYFDCFPICNETHKGGNLINLLICCTSFMISMIGWANVLKLKHISLGDTH